MKSILILSDIEGSTLCGCQQDAQLFNDGWARACGGLTQDLNVLCRRLKKAGATRIKIKDFHRTGYNIMKKQLIPGIELDQGYVIGPATGIGDVTGFAMLMMIGMHAASGTTGFLPHTLTSKFAGVEVNGRPLCEAELFAASVAEFNLKPVFFSGDTTACAQATSAIPGLAAFAIEKPLINSAATTRELLVDAAVEAFQQTLKKPGDAKPYQPRGPFITLVKMRDGEVAAAKQRQRWQLQGSGNRVEFIATDMQALYWQLIKLAYLTPTTYKLLGTALNVVNFAGKVALLWANRRLSQIQI